MYHRVIRYHSSFEGKPNPNPWDLTTNQNRQIIKIRSTTFFLSEKLRKRFSLVSYHQTCTLEGKVRGPRSRDSLSFRNVWWPSFSSWASRSCDPSFSYVVRASLPFPGLGVWCYHSWSSHELEQNRSSERNLVSTKQSACLKCSGREHDRIIKLRTENGERNINSSWKRSSLLCGTVDLPSQNHGKKGESDEISDVKRVICEIDLPSNILSSQAFAFFFFL